VSLIDVDVPMPRAGAAGLYLWEPNLGILSLDCDTGYVVTELDLGFPVVRESVWNLPLRNGTHDDTAFTGARAVSIPMVLDGRKAPTTVLLDRLRAYVNPALRPALLFTPADGGVQRILRLRGVDAPAVVKRPRSVEVVAQWVTVGSGLMESAERHCRTLRPGEGQAVGGRTYDWTPPRNYPDAIGPAGSYLIVNEGSAPAAWTATVYGAITNPVLTINGQRVAFTRHGGLDLANGNYVVLDAEARTVLADNGESRYDRWDFTAGWPLLRAGDNYVDLAGDAHDASASVEFCWRSAWY
jgi:hypothetical protein